MLHLNLTRDKELRIILQSFCPILLFFLFDIQYVQNGVLEGRVGP